MFSDEFRHGLAKGEYTNWAVDLTEEDLQSLLWTIGEYGFRAPLVLKLLEEHKGEIWWQDEGFARAKVALEILFHIVDGKRMSIDDVTQRIREVLAQVRSTRREAPEQKNR
ncbi:MAG: hypothetical protein HY040_15410 [Planctomycetes bacterium]|nr:hypothetical protein [Planctomycetota bacterium]